MTRWDGGIVFKVTTRLQALCIYSTAGICLLELPARLLSDGHQTLCRYFVAIHSSSRCPLAGHWMERHQVHSHSSPDSQQYLS